MKGLCVVILLCGVVGIAHGALTCFGDETKCADDECCVQIANTPVATCKKLAKLDELCEMKPFVHLIRKHVYKVRCKCERDDLEDGLECRSVGGVIGNVMGTCKERKKEEDKKEETD